MRATNLADKTCAPHPLRFALRPFPGGGRREWGAIVAAMVAWLGSGAACVEGAHPADASIASGMDASIAPIVSDGSWSETTAATCGLPPVAYSVDGGISIPSATSVDAEAPGASVDAGAPAYAWKNVVIKGGGFVSGIIMSPVLPGLVFARTDVGGAYRYDPAGKRWMALTDWVGRNNSNLLGIESIAPDPVDPHRVYMAAGMYVTAGNGSILSSTDMGQTWAQNNIAAPMGGNADGRSMGERLAIDPNLTSTLYFGSRTTGLWKSADYAQTWAQVPGFPTTGVALNDAGASKGYGLTFVVFDRSSGSPGTPTPTIYVGVGATTETGLYRSTDAGATWQAVPGQPPIGMMPHHAVFDGCGNLYFAYNNGSGPNSISSGAVWRYATDTGVWTPVSPPQTGGGFGGISADPAHPGTLIVTTLDRWSRDEIYRTTNGGASWVAIESAAQDDVAGAPWVLWHRTSVGTPGWMGDVEIDPFNPGRALYITGGGIWSSNDVTAADTGAATHWTFDDDGLEETVVQDLISPPAGAPLLSAVGDLGGFRHDDVNVSPAGGFFSNPIFGSGSSLDFAEGAPGVVVRVGSPSGGQSGAYSIDGGTTWTPFATTPPPPAGATFKGSGSIAISADATTFVWAAQSATPAYSIDSGKTWTACTGLAAGARVAADRVNPAKFYASCKNASNQNATCVSTDGGVTFVPAAASVSGRPRPVFGIEGDVWVPTGSGLFHSQDSAATFAQVSQVNSAAAVGFGMPAPGQSYPAVYLNGSVANVWGTYRSDDAGATWLRLDDPQHQFGWINCVAGDPRIYGRVYLGTGGRGILYGDLR
jgi:hypothetical protein